VALETEHYWTLGGDMVLDMDLPNGGLRMWVDGHAGASWYEHEDKAEDDTDATFVAVRVIVAYRFGGTEDGELYVEPYGTLGVFEPDVDVTSDFLWEETLGINVGFWDYIRFSLQAGLSNAQRNFPSAYFGGQDQERRQLLLFAGAKF
jgi:hypothetical protein